MTKQNLKKKNLKIFFSVKDEKKYMKKSGFAIWIDSKNQQEKCIFKKSLHRRLKYPEMILMPFYATGPFIFDSWPLGPKHKMQ